LATCIVPCLTHFSMTRGVGTAATIRTSAARVASMMTHPWWVSRSSVATCSTTW
jgi:hypothetical protein